jgi:hypothetical protein
MKNEKINFVECFAIIIISGVLFAIAITGGFVL